MKRRMGNYQNHIKLSSNYREKKRKKKTRNGILKSSKEPQLPTDLTIKHKKVKHLTIEDIHRDVPRMGESVAKVAKPSSRKTTRGRHRDSKIL